MKNTETKNLAYCPFKQCVLSVTPPLSQLEMAFLILSRTIWTNNKASILHERAPTVIDVAEFWKIRALWMLLIFITHMAIPRRNNQTKYLKIGTDDLFPPVELNNSMLFFNILRQSLLVQGAFIPLTQEIRRDIIYQSRILHSSAQQGTTPAKDCGAQRLCSVSTLLIPLLCGNEQICLSHCHPVPLQDISLTWADPMF